MHRVVRPPASQSRGSARDVTVFFQAHPLNALRGPVVFADEVGHATLCDQLYRLAGPDGAIRFSQLRARMFTEFIEHSKVPDAQHEMDAHRRRED